VNSNSNNSKLAGKVRFPIFFSSMCRRNYSKFAGDNDLLSLGRVLKIVRSASPMKADIRSEMDHVSFVPIVFSNSGFECQALRHRPR
jgi:hypothetical protein